MTGRRRKLLQILIVILLLVVGAGIVFFLIQSRPQPQTGAGASRSTLVEVKTVAADRHQLQIHARGAVQPDRRLRLRSQVAGYLEEVSEQLVPGRRVAAGSLLARVEPDDYRVAVERAEAAVTQAEAGLALERGRSKVAETSWSFFEDRVDQEEAVGNRSLVLREPQRRASAARLRDARARLEQARLNLERTRITAPFASVIESEEADEGQLVGRQDVVATLVGSDAFRVQAAIPVSRLPFLPLPDSTSPEAAPVTATVELDTGDDGVRYPARIVELLPDVDPGGRMAKVLLRVDQPLESGAARNGDKSRLPLLLNTYVKVSIDTAIDRELIRLPRTALRRRDRVFVYRDGQLEIIEPALVWRGSEHVYAATGGPLADGDRVVTSPLTAAVEGMALRLSEKTKANSTETPATEEASRR